MAQHALKTGIVDDKTRANSVRRFKEAGILLPTFAQLADPARIPGHIRKAMMGVGPDEPNPINLFRVHWHNNGERTGMAAVPEHMVLPESLTGVPAPIIVAFGNRFPMIRAHKVLAAYGCLVPRIVSGEFDPTRHKAVWPSTGNYCRGGVAISRIMQCHGVAVLPEGMSRERFEWLAQWAADPSDIVRTPGTESNVKEIYDKCAELEKDPGNFIFNQFSEFANYLAHATVTGPALERAFEAAAGGHGWRLFGFTSATGSAGTIAAGDYLKERYGARIVAAEALECPTLLENGFGEHNIQGIGDKHVPLIHNVMNTDLVTAISDRSTDELDLLFNSPAGHEYLTGRKGVSPEIVAQLKHLGFSSICNILAAIKTAKYFNLGSHDALVTVATDGSELYTSEHQKMLARHYPAGFDTVNAGEVYSQHLKGIGTDNMLELTHRQKSRIFNLGYYTWVEQQHVPLADFEARRDQAFWKKLHDLVPAWDTMIEEFNAATGVTLG